MNKEIINQPRAIVHSLLFGLSGTPLSIGAPLFITMKEIKPGTAQYLAKTISPSIIDKAGVYKITNIKRDRIYVGSTSNSFRVRMMAHISNLKNCNHHSYKLQEDFMIDGLENFIFEVLEEALPCDVIKIEQRYLDLISPYYNILSRADSCLGHKMSSEHCHNISIAKTKKVDEQGVIDYYIKYGIAKTAQKFHIGGPRINKIIDKHNIIRNKSGPSIKTMTNYVKYNHNEVIAMYQSGMSIRNIRKILHTDFKRVRETLNDYGIEIIKHPPATQSQKESLSKSLRGKSKSEQWRNNIAKAKTGKKLGGDNIRARKVLNKDIGVIYSSIKEVSELYGIVPQSLSDRLHGRTKNDTQFVLLKKDGITPDIKPYALNLKKKLRRAFKKENLLA
jgi:group I intron endonuclease